MADANQDHFTELEEEFFRAGTAVSEIPEPDTFADLDDAPPPRPLWRRLFPRRSQG